MKIAEDVWVLTLAAPKRLEMGEGRGCLKDQKWGFCITMATRRTMGKDDTDINMMILI
jgi:hypothetical protein